MSNAGTERSGSEQSLLFRDLIWLLAWKDLILNPDWRSDLDPTFRNNLNFKLIMNIWIGYTVRQTGAECDKNPDMRAHGSLARVTYEYDIMTRSEM